MSKHIITIILVALLSSSCNKDDDAKASRTVLIYMAADNSLSTWSYFNINQMKEHIAEAPSNSNLLVYLDAADDVPHLILINKDGEKVLITYPEQNSASVEVMSKVIDDACRLFPAYYYGLVLWSHATGWLPSRISHPDLLLSDFNDTTLPYIRTPSTRAFAQDGSSWMELADLVEAIPDKRFDFILLDACYMGSVEVAYALRGKAEYLIASPTEVLDLGFPYHKVTNLMLTRHPDFNAICEAYYSYYNGFIGLMQSSSIALIKTSELPKLMSLINEIVSPSCDRIASLDVQGIQCYDRFRRHILFDVDDYMAQVATAEQLSRFRQQLDRAVPFKRATTRFYETFDLVHFSGLSMYIPQPPLERLTNFYRQLSGSELLLPTCNNVLIE